MGDEKMLTDKMWWIKGECWVTVLKTGHYPDTVMVELPTGVMTEVYRKDLLEKQLEP